MRFALHMVDNERIVQAVGSRYSAIAPIALVRQQAVGEMVFTQISLRVGEHGAFQSGQPHDVPANVVAVFAVIKQADAVITLAQIDPLMGAALKSSPIPGCVVVGWALNVAPLNLVSRSRAKDVGRESDLEQQPALSPVYPGVKIDPGAIRVPYRRAVRSRY